MSHNFDSPIRTQMAVAVLNGPLGREYHGTDGMEVVKPSGRRRVFVQTETGCVLGMELDRSDSAHTVKRRLQVALNVPVEESCLTFGDTVLKNDLSAVRNDSPLLLTRNVIHRSSSSPCLSPTGRDMQQRDWSGPVEILGHSSKVNRTKQLVTEIVKGMKIGVDPIPVQSGLGGAYYFRNCRGESVAIVKPTDEEPYAPNNPKGFVGRVLGQPGLKRSIRVGETGYREVAAYLLDYGHFANVPPTALVKISHSIFNINDNVNNNKPSKMKKHFSKLASLQQFIPHDFDASDHGTSSFPVSAVHRVGILDIRIFNTDRHAGNLLVKKLNDDGVERFSQVELVPIDHGLCLPENLEDPYFEWIHWPQASIPFSEEELKYIEDLNPYHDADMLQTELPMIREASLRVLILCTIFLKEAAAYGLTLAEIGEMMSREFRRGEEEPSELELICMDARRFVAELESEREVFVSVSSPKPKGKDDSFQFQMDGCDDSGFNFSDDFMSPNLHSHFGFGRNPLSKLQETIEEDDEEHSLALAAPGSPYLGSNQSMLPKNNSFTGHDLKSLKTKAENKGYGYGYGYGNGGVNSSSGHRSANEQLPASASFVKFGDMNETEWCVFLEKFQELVYPAFANRKSASVGQKQLQRLGTSCQF
ncbi:hypothetical protein R6Q57_013951 [Mikania cordata]